jgi:choline dehydrogenase-like flavoprotein
MSPNDAGSLRDAGSKEINGSQSSFIASLKEFLAMDFDYLVLGGGTAGCVVAGRLAENPNIAVGIMEAGKYRKNDPLVDTPTALGAMFENPEYDWCCYTAPQV